MEREMLWSAMLGTTSLVDRLDAALTNGYRGLTVRPGDLDRLAGDDLDPAEVMRRARDGGIEHVVMEALSGWYDHVAPSVPFPSAHETLDDHLRAAELVGAGHLNLVAPFKTTTESLESLTEKYDDICERCADAGLLVHLEFIPFPPIDSLRVAWEVVRAAGRTNGGIMFDTWHFFRGEPDTDLLATIPGDRIFSVQVSDGAAEIRESLVKDTFRHRLLPGDGVFDLVGVLTTLQAIGGLRLAGPEVLSTELDALPPAEAAGIAGDAFDRVAAAI